LIRRVANLNEIDAADAHCDRQFRYYDHHKTSCVHASSAIGSESVPRREKVMPYLHLDLPGRFPAAQKRELAVRLCRLYADVMQTQSWRPNVGIAELGEDNLFHLGADGLEPIVMVLVEFRAGRPSDYRLKLADGIVDACVEVLKVPRRWVLVEFTPHVGEEIYRDGKWVADWTPEEGAPVH
jgi:phenylpyruvate tautomerase PptA (4-oxalocrotonate tautomerase family)